jgi:superfamily I DNA/RNA helicase
VLRVYAAYEAQCRRAGLVDFAELLLRAHELLRDHAGTAGALPQRFRHLLVDEFQDTNAIQYGFVRLLGRRQRAACSWLATTTRPSTAGAARKSRTCSISCATSPCATHQAGAELPFQRHILRPPTR